MDCEQVRVMFSYLDSTEVAVELMKFLTVQTWVDVCSQYQITLSMAQVGLLTRARPCARETECEPLPAARLNSIQYKISNVST